MDRVEVDRNGLEVLPREECVRLLKRATLGRIAVTSGSLPTMFPVNFHCDGNEILVRTGEGTKLHAALDNAIVAFEVDDFDSMYHSGWSVVVTGRSRAVAADCAFYAVRTMPLARWAPAGGGHLMAISLDIVSGRRLRAAGAPWT
jgi:nitroimidazol reductase NimA-like FMN-containing flavoprotein (pyridoxamine 5'-phosphate oxidase superfamily)